MTLRQRYDFVLNWFREHKPIAETELRYDNPYELIVSVILSAQCTDKRVNSVTPALFAQFPVVEMLAEAKTEEVFEHIKSVSFANNKTRHLLGMAKRVVEVHAGEVPQSMEELVLLPGVGRKTANVVRSVAWGHAAMAVDTHVFRVAARIGLTAGAKTPTAAELQLLKYIPEEELHVAHHWLILHGRYICVARRPKCEECALKPACKYFKSEMQYVVAGKHPYDPESDVANKVSSAGKRREGGVEEGTV